MMMMMMMMVSDCKVIPN